MASFRSIEWTFGAVPGDVDDDRLISTWVEVCLAYARSLGLE